MNVTAVLIEKAKLNQGLNSDYQLANLLNVDRQKISNWKNARSEANAEMTLRLMKLADESIDAILNKYQKGFSRLSLLLVTASASTLAMASFLTVKHCILCQIKWQLAKTRHAHVTVLKSITNLKIA